jgi:hypothetical protein
MLYVYIYTPLYTHCITIIVYPYYIPSPLVALLQARVAEGAKTPGQTADEVTKACAPGAPGVFWAGTGSSGVVDHDPSDDVDDNWMKIEHFGGFIVSSLGNSQLLIFFCLNPEVNR